MLSPEAREIARQLIAHEVGSADGPAAAAVAMQRLCTRVSENLRRSVGEDGRNALLARALARTQAEHPALVDVRRIESADIFIDGVVASVDAHGLPAVALAVESMLAAVVDVLTGLIGADMVLNLLLDDSAPPFHMPNGKPIQ